MTKKSIETIRSYSVDSVRDGWDINVMDVDSAREYGMNIYFVGYHNLIFPSFLRQQGGHITPILASNKGAVEKQSIIKILGKRYSFSN